MSVRVWSRASATRLLIAVISICSLTALLLTTRVKTTLVQIADAAGSKADDVNNDPGDRVQAPNPHETLQRLRDEGPEYRFQWSHWLNLDMSELYDYGNLDPAFYPRLSSIDDLSQMAMPYTVDTTQREAAMVGELYCRHRMPAPAHVIALSDSHANRSQPAEVWNVHHVSSEMDHLQYGHTNYTPQTVKTTFFASDLASDDAAVRLIPEIGDDLFRWNARGAAETLEDSDDDEDKAHAQMLRSAVAHVQTSGKHFEETRLLFDSIGFGNHYDWRFFRRVESCTDRAQTIEALAHAWSQFASQFGVESWWAHGSVLGWMWNGLTMPWDTDIDLQVPIKTLDRLAWEFNNTLIVPSANDGSRAYLLEVSPWYVQRENGNGLNVIDARFIDTTTGTYADITGLAYYGKNSKIACKSPHYYARDEISPLRRSKFEGTTGYIPAKYAGILKDEYDEAFKPIFKTWKFNAKSRLWSNLENELKKKETNFYANAVRTPADLLSWSECEYHLYGTCDKVEIEEYESTKDFTLAHEVEMELWDQIPFNNNIDEARAAPAVTNLLDLHKTEFSSLHRQAE